MSLNNNKGVNFLIHGNINIDEYKLINFINMNKKEIRMVRNWRNSDLIRKWMVNDNIISLESHLNFIEKLKTDKNNAYWIVKKNNDYIGVISLTNISWTHRNAFTGLYVNPDNIGKGNGKKLLSIILNIAFKILKLHTLKLEVFENNNIAIRLYKKFGFEEEGVLREFIYRNDKWINVIVMGIINNEKEC